MKPSRLAVDTNLLLDLAAEIPDVIDVLDVIDNRLPNAERLVTPSVLDQLAYLADFSADRMARQYAQKAILLLREKDRFLPVLQLPFASENSESLADEFRRRELLPETEVHDALILAEAILLNCHILLTSDEHLRSIDHQQLTWLLHQHDLIAPVIATPREIVRKFFR